MHIPIELQKHILSFLKGNTETIYNTKGRCICRTNKHTRCKRKVNYLETLTCCKHNHLEIPELFAHINYK